MDSVYLEAMFDILERKIVEKAAIDCIGCLTLHPSQKNHTCVTPDESSVEHFFEAVWETFEKRMFVQLCIGPNEKGEEFYSTLKRLAKSNLETRF